MHKIPFNSPYIIENELNYIKDAVERRAICGDGHYTKLCQKWLEYYLNVKKALLTNSCTAALEMSAILADIQQGDEVIMPSYTFVSTANAFVLRGAKPVFVDIKLDTLNIDENIIEKAITSKTKAIVVVHYAGIACEMDKIQAIAQKYNLLLIEDAAQALSAKYKGKLLGTFGDFATFSFHETKNVISGEGGALIINNEKFIERAEIIREKGTNRSQFFRGEIDKYTWVDIGSSFLPGEIIAAYLYSQLENIEKINKKRKKIWNIYHSLFKQYQEQSFIKRQFIPEYCEHNAHMYYILFKNLRLKTKFITYLSENNIHSVFHYIPLHRSKAGKKYGKTPFEMPVTNNTSDTLLRMPMFYDLTDEEMDYISEIVDSFFRKI